MVDDKPSTAIHYKRLLYGITQLVKELMAEAKFQANADTSLLMQVW